MEFSKIDADDLLIRGKSWNNQTLNGKFFESLLFMITGKSFSDSQLNDLSMLMLTFMDHGSNTASAMSARNSASVGNPMNASIASGILSLGPKHGLAIGPAMRLLSSVDDATKFVEDCIRAKMVIPGFGHPIYEEDPRTVLLEENFTNSYPSIKLGRRIEALLSEMKGKKICLNIDGFAACVFMDLGINPDEADALFIISRSIGLAGHSIDQRNSGKLIRKSEE